MLTRTNPKTVADIAQRTVGQHGLDASLPDLEAQQRHRSLLNLREEIQQLLVAARLYLRAGVQNLPNRQTAPEFEKAAECITEALAEARALGAELRPPAQVDGGLRAALNALGRETKRIHGIPLAVEVSPALEGLDPATESCGVQAVRELVQSLLQCGHPTSMAIRALVTDAGHPRIQVRVHGVKIDLCAERLAFIRFIVTEHLQQVGGQLDIETPSSRETCVTIDLPSQTGAKIPVVGSPGFPADASA